MPAPRGDRQTVADPHRAFAAKLKKQIEAGIAPWQKPGTPGARVPVEPIKEREQATEKEHAQLAEKYSRARSPQISHAPTPQPQAPQPERESGISR